MSKAEAVRLRALEERVAVLERALMPQSLDDETGADHEAHKAIFPRKTLTLNKAKQ